MSSAGPTPATAPPSASITFEGARRVFRSRHEEVAAVDGIDLHVPAGSFFTLLGPSGCGKSTALRLIAGLERLDAGRIRIGADVVADADQHVDVPPNRRGIGMVFQSYAVWPHLSVAENVAYPLRVRREPRAHIRPQVEAMLELVGLAGLGRRRPSELSGGQQQRVALARALIHHPSVLLLDEPFSNLDTDLREALGEEVRRLQQELGLTVVYVTHDRREALLLSDHIGVVDHGRLLQSGPPQEVFEQPVSSTVAGFVGPTNLLEAELVGPGRDGRVVVATALGQLTATWPRHVGPPPAEAGARLLLNVRPQHILRGDPGGADACNVVRARVTGASFRGPTVALHLDAGAGPLTLRVPLSAAAAPGEEVVLSFPHARTIVLEDGLRTRT